MIRFSSSWLWLTARPVWQEEHRAVKDLLAHASEDLPGGLPVRPGTARPVSW